MINAGVADLVVSWTGFSFNCCVDQFDEKFDCRALMFTRALQCDIIAYGSVCP
jgi:hypothetical protein